MKGISQNTYSDIGNSMFQEIETVKDKVSISRKAKMKHIKYKVHQWFVSNF